MRRITHFILSVSIGLGLFGSLCSAASAALTIASAPAVPSQIGTSDDLTFNLTVNNSGAESEPFYALVALTQPGTINTKEFYNAGLIATPGNSTHPIRVTAAQMRSQSVGAGRWNRAVNAYDKNDQKVNAGFFGLLTIGTVGLSLPLAPTFPSQIGSTGDLTMNVTVDNSGNAPENFYVLTVLTPPGFTSGPEFYKTGLIAPPGRSSHPVTITAAELQARGIVPGRWNRAVFVYDGTEKKFLFPINPSTNASSSYALLTIGTINLTLPDPLLFPSSVGLTSGDVVFDVTVNNSGNAPDLAYAVAVFTKPGSTLPADSLEIYKTRLSMPPGRITHRIIITAAELQANGVVGGRWTRSVLVYDGTESRLEFPSKTSFGLFTRGTINLSLPNPLSIPTQIGTGDNLTFNVDVDNSGDAPDTAYILTVLTKPGSTAAADSHEFYKTKLAVPVGRSNHPITITRAERESNNVAGGRWNRAAFLYDGTEKRIAFPNNTGFGLLTIGSITLNIPTEPTVPVEIGPNDDLKFDLTVVNSGNVPDLFTAFVALTVPGSNPPATKEFYIKNLAAPVGSSTHPIVITAADRQAQGVGPGQWNRAASGFDGSGKRLESYFGPLTLGTVSLSLQQPTVTNQIPLSGDLEFDATVNNTGSAPAALTLVVALTKPGSTNPADSHEFPTSGLTAPPGLSSYHIKVTSAQMQAAGVGGGRWNRAVTGLDGAGRKLESYFGLLTIGTITLSLPVAPTVPGEIGLNQDLEFDLVVENTGNAPDLFTALLILSKPGSALPSDSHEFAVKFLPAPLGRSTVHVKVTAQDRRDAGVGSGAWNRAATGLDGASKRLESYFDSLIIRTS